MGLFWFKKDKIYPEFWESYVSCFDSIKREYRETFGFLIRKQQAWIFEQM
jgi:hypothetical protein